MSHHMIPAYVFRRRARQAMGPVMSILVLVTLIAMLPSLISQTITTMTESDPTAALAELYTEERAIALAGEDEQAALTALEEIGDGMKRFVAEKWPLMALTGAITLLFGPVLTLGQNHAMLRVLRGEEITAATVLVRLPLFFKAIGLELMKLLRILLWELPGLAVMTLGAGLSFIVPLLGMLVMIGGMALTFVMVVRAMYSLRLATYVMAEEPEVGISEALHRSTRRMNGRRMELFGLEISFLGWRLLYIMVQALLLGMLGSVIGYTLSLFVSFMLQMYIYMTEAAFYQEYAMPADAKAAPAAPAENDPN